MNPTDIKSRFDSALASFVEKIKSDSNIRAVVLCGSLANDTVWEKSDMDIEVLVRETKSGTKSFCIDEDGIILNVNVQSEFDFKRELERTVGGDWMYSYYSQAKVMYSKDESFVHFIKDFQKVGADDRASSFFHASTWLIGILEKIEKWLSVKDDPQYAQLWCLKAAEVYANMRLVLDNKPPSREAVLKVMAYAPEEMKYLYERPMQGFMTREEVWDLLKFHKKFLENNVDLLSQPVTEYMSDGEVRTVTTLCKHFRMRSHDIYHAFDFLEEMGTVARVTENVRITAKIRSSLEEVAFIYIKNMEAYS